VVKSSIPEFLLVDFTANSMIAHFTGDIICYPEDTPHLNNPAGNQLVQSIFPLFHGMPLNHQPKFLDISEG
jgi:hypothetical protein